MRSITVNAQLNIYRYDIFQANRLFHAYCRRLSPVSQDARSQRLTQSHEHTHTQPEAGHDVPVDKRRAQQRRKLTVQIRSLIKCR